MCGVDWWGGGQDSNLASGNGGMLLRRLLKRQVCNANPKVCYLAGMGWLLSNETLCGSLNRHRYFQFATGTGHAGGKMDRDGKTAIPGRREPGEGRGQSTPANLVPPTKSTEDQVCMCGIVPQRIDKQGTRVEDIAGTGQHDSLGG
jgi:hypothetical protein